MARPIAVSVAFTAMARRSATVTFASESVRERPGASGTGRILEGLESFRFGDEELAFLADRRVVDERTAERQFLLHATGQLVRQLVLGALEPDEGDGRGPAEAHWTTAR